MKQSLIAAGLALLLASAARADPDALWKIVHDQCVPDQEKSGDPAPCAQVDLGQGYAVLKDRRGATQYLLIPTDKIAGIESAALLTESSPNYWRAAWDSRRFVEAKAGRPIPVDDLGMVVNSAYGRSQNQLHIHIDCVLPAVKQAIAANIARIGADWADLDVDLVGHRYRAKRMPAAALTNADPFKMLATGDPAARADMGRETLAVLGVLPPEGGEAFVLLSDRADVAGMDVASSETLLDHDCAVLKP